MPLSESRKAYLKRRLELYLEAEEMILRGQSYRIGTRYLARADLTAVQGEIRRLEAEIEADGAKKRTYRVVPRDL